MWVRVIVLVALLGTACAHPAVEPSLPRPVPQGRVTDHVLIISVDGLRPDAIGRFAAPTIQRLMREGSYAPDAQTILPSTTLPSHTSMLTGVDPAAHGITWNTDETADRGYVRVPTVFGLARAAGLRTAAFFGKSKLNHIHSPATLDYVHAFDSRLPWRGSGGHTARLVGRHLEQVRPNLLFVHLIEADYAGHLFGWMGRLYGQAVLEADAAVGALLVHADEHFGRGQYIVILTADHGGHGLTHGTDLAEDTTIPWIVWGEGVRAGTQLPFGIRTTDTAATALWLLGVPVPAEWTGHAVTQAFDTTTVAPVP
ncbi:MAG: ectonucleotide pyrophosphatase/phosphodiesterase [Gemmatimonadota bacterium]|nr:ectonucleotide pyrophosphatase/phosphodiesterase [Gemmatimonadota bacterium]